MDRKFILGAVCLAGLEMAVAAMLHLAPPRNGVDPTPSSSATVLPTPGEPASTAYPDTPAL